MNKSEMKLRKNKGISMLALVISIIILLILAAITLKVVMGENGLITKTKQAKTLSNSESAREQIQVAVNSGYGLDDLNKNLKKINGLKFKDNEISDLNEIQSLPATVTLNNCVFMIDDDGNVIFQGIMGEDIIAYDNAEEQSFEGGNYLNTGVCLYSEENIHKNFLISFNIVEVGEENVNHSTLLSSMDESGSPWPGHNVKVSVDGNNKRVKFESNSNTNSEGDVYIPNTVTNVRIIRINDILYYSFDGNNCIKINDYTGFTNYFDLPLTFGAALDSNNKPFRYFQGTLSDMTLKFISDNAKIEDYNPPKKALKTAYQHLSAYKFNGTSDYIDTGLCMFTAENLSKDFEISFTIDSIESGYVNQASILNAKREINPYPGFVYRLYTADSTIKFDSKGGTGNGSNNKQSDVIGKNIKISRVDKKMYLSIDNSAEKEIYDYTDFTGYHNVPLTIGSSLDGTGKPFRFFKGTLSNIIVKFEKD